MRENNSGKEALSTTAGKTINLSPELAIGTSASRARISKTADTRITLLPCESAKAPATIDRKPAKTLLTIAKRFTRADRRLRRYVQVVTEEIQEGESV